MALQRPYNLSLKGQCIDANEDNTVSWQVSGDIQTAYKIDISSNVDNSLVFTSNQISSYSLKYIIPSATLTNGNEYKITVTIWNDTGSSITSDAEVFQVSSRPVVTVDPIGTVNSFSYQFSAQYFQSENVALRNYNVNLYDDKKVLINNSDILIANPLQYLFSNLQTETSYYIEFIATSSKGLTGTSGLISFDCFYYRPKMNIQLEGKNIDKAGIEISWFVRQIIGNSDNQVDYLNNEEANLLDGNRIYFNDGFSIDRDFSLKLWLREFPHNVPLLTLTGDNGSIILKYNAIQEAFLITKTTTLISGSYKSNSIVEYAYLSPYQLIETTGEKAVILIQQVGMDMNLSVDMYN